MSTSSELAAIDAIEKRVQDEEAARKGLALDLTEHTPARVGTILRYLNAARADISEGSEIIEAAQAMVEMQLSSDLLAAARMLGEWSYVVQNEIDPEEWARLTDGRACDLWHIMVLRFLPWVHA